MRSSLLALAVCLSLSLAPAVAEANDWKEHVSDVCGAAATMPGAPQRSDQEIDSLEGKKTMTMYILEVPDGAYGYGCVEGNKKEPRKLEQRLDEARDGMMSAMNGKIVSEKKVKFMGVTGREVRGDIEGTYVVVARMFFVKNRYYQTMVLVPAAGADKRDGDIKRFMDSFRVGPAKKKGK